MSRSSHRTRLAAIALAGLTVAAIFAALGTWQLQRRAWKLDLIARVTQRLAARPTDAPDPSQWPTLTRAADEYRRIRITGRYLPHRATLVSATTIVGPGYWLIEPFRDVRGFTILVNRGYVPTRVSVFPNEATTVTGLLRLSEPKGDLLRSNDPPADLWYSRDTAAIARARHLGPVAPYFIDAAAPPDPAALPRAGLTVIAFPNNHLVYALTWYTLMAMTLAATTVAIRRALCRA